jgi:hypothetical protein
VTLENIYFLLSKRLPSRYGPLNGSLFDEIEQHLKDAMLLEIINQVLKLNIKRRDFQAGKELISKVGLSHAGPGLPAQLVAWARLCVAADEGNEAYLKGHLEDFMKQENALNDISTLKTYLRKVIRENHHI